MPLSISVIQNGNGTATVTIAGSGVTAVNSVFAKQVGTQWDEELLWTFHGSRTGDGAVVATTGKGAWWFYCRNNELEVSEPVYRMVLDGQLSVWHQILDAVQAKVRILALETTSGVLPSGDVHVRELLEASEVLEVRKPVAYVAPAGPEGLTARGPLQSDDWEYPIRVAYALPGNRNQQREFSEIWMRNRERLRQAFVNQPLSIPSGVVPRCAVRPLDPVSETFWRKNTMLSEMVLVFDSREPRGM